MYDCINGSSAKHTSYDAAVYLGIMVINSNTKVLFPMRIKSILRAVVGMSISSTILTADDSIDSLEIAVSLTNGIDSMCVFTYAASQRYVRQIIRLFS